MSDEFIGKMIFWALLSGVAFVFSVVKYLIKEAKKPNAQKEFVKNLRESGFDSSQIELLENAFASGKDYQKYCDKRFDKGQMEQIQKGVDSGISVDEYLDPSLPWTTMYEIRRRLERELDKSN